MTEGRIRLLFRPLTCIVKTAHPLLRYQVYTVCVGVCVYTRVSQIVCVFLLNVIMFWMIPEQGCLFFFNLLPLYIILYIFCFLVTLEESQILVLLKLCKKE